MSIQLTTLLLAFASLALSAEEPLRRADDIIRDYSEKAKNSADPVMVWHEAARVENVDVRVEAISKINEYADVRSLILLDELANHKVERSLVRPHDAPPHYPTLAAGVAKRIRAKQTFSAMMARTPDQEQLAVSIQEFKKEYKIGGSSVLEWIYEFWISLPPSKEVVTTLLTWPRIGDDRLRKYLVALDKEYDPLLCKSLHEAENYEHIAILVDVLIKRKHKETLPLIIRELDVKRRGKSFGGDAAIAEVVAIFGDDVIPLLEDRWAVQEDTDIKDSYAIVLRNLASPKAEETLQKWITGTKDLLLKLREINQGNTQKYHDNLELLHSLKVHADAVKKKSDK